MTRSRAAFIFIFITVLLDMVSFGVIIPVFPQLILRLQGGDMPGAAAIFGILGTAFAVMQVIFAPVQGALSDRYGRRPVILLSNLGLGVDYVVMAVAPTIPILFIGRLISGATSASFSISGAYVADVTPPEKRAARRSEEHTSELQSRENLVCRLLLEKKNNHHLSQRLPRPYTAFGVELAPAPCLDGSISVAA